MKKILYIDPQSGDNLAMYDYELLSRIHNFNITYVRSTTYNYENIENIHHQPIFSYTTKKNPFSKGISYCWSLVKLYRLIRSTKPDIIHIQWFRLPKIEYYYYKNLKKKLNVKIVHTVHNLLPHVSKKNDYYNFSRLYSLCDGFIVHTETAYNNFISKFEIKNPVTIAPHGPLRYKYSDKEINREIRELKNRYQINAKYIIALLGYQSRYKGTDMAIEAWRKSKALSTNEDICLIVAGKNRDFKTINQEKDKNLIIINSRLTDLMFAAFMRMSDILLLPYRTIEQSGVLLSIITEQIPYCSTKVGELTKPFEYGDIGWTIDTPSTEAIRIQLERIFTNPKEIALKKNNTSAWGTIQNLYSWDKAAEKTIDLYNKLS